MAGHLDNVGSGLTIAGYGSELVPLMEGAAIGAEGVVGAPYACGEGDAGPVTIPGKGTVGVGL